MTTSHTPTAYTVLRERARLMAHCRRFFAERDVLEVDTPILGPATVTDLHLDSLDTRLVDGRRLYLQTSPEYAMKRLLARGVGDIYQLGHVFRNEPTGRHHHPEFMLLEWYRIGFDLDALIAEVIMLLGELIGARLSHPPEIRTYRDAFLGCLGVDPFHCDQNHLAALAKQAGASVGDCDRDTLLDLLMAVCVGPTLGRARLTVITDYPASQAALARLRPGNPRRAARFEAYCEGIELCNGFHELTDVAEQRARFEADLRKRQSAGRPAVEIDEALLTALESGLPDCSGVAVGFDRVVMLATGCTRLSDVMPFSLD